MAKSSDGKGGGYGKPPEGRRFKKGQSGNPRGRPRRPRTADEAILAALNQKASISVNGRRKRVTALETIALKSVALAAQGDLEGLSKLAKMSKDLPAGPPEVDAAEVARKKTEFRRLFVLYVDWLELRDLLEGCDAIVLDQSGRPTLTEAALDRLFSPAFDPVRKDELIAQYRKCIACRSEGDFDPNIVLEENRSSAVDPYRHYGQGAG